MRLDLNNEKDIKKISKRIRISYQKLSGRINGSDDCIQEVLKRMLEGKHQHSTIDQAVIDYLRSNYGDKRLSSYIERQKFNNSNSFEPGELENIIGFDDRKQSSNRLDFNECSKWIGNQIDKAILGLYFKWGLNEVEIGHLFGFSESRVSQRLQRVQKCISTRIKIEKSRDEKEAKKKMEGILSKETKRNMWRVEQISFERMEIGQSICMETFNEISF